MARRAEKEVSRVTGKRFNKQDPKGRRHGPQKRRKVYALAIEKVLCSHWAKEPLTSVEIAELANKDISNHWTKLNGFSVGAIMRKYEKEGLVTSERVYNKGVGQKVWTRDWDFPLQSDYEYHGGNWKGNPRVNVKDPVTGKWKRITASDENLKKILKIERGG